MDGWRQDAVSDSTVLVAGIGALGCELAKNLALAGIGRLVLVDMDTIEMSNLSRQMLFQEEDIGKGKAATARRRLGSMAPDTEIVIHDRKFQELEPAVWEEVDVIAGGLDSFAARDAMNSIVARRGIPYVDGAVTGYKGSVQVIIPSGDGEEGGGVGEALPEATPCFRCMFPMPAADGKIYGACTIPGVPRTREHCVIKAEDKFVGQEGRREKGYSEEDLDKITGLADEIALTGSDEDFDRGPFSTVYVKAILENKIPSVITVNAVIASVQSHEILKLLHRLRGADIGPPMEPPYLEFNATYGIFSPVELERNPDCPYCSPEALRVSRAILPPGITFARLLSSMVKRGTLGSGNVLVTDSLTAKAYCVPGRSGDRARTLQAAGVVDGAILRITELRDGKKTQHLVEIKFKSEGKPTAGKGEVNRGKGEVNQGKREVNRGKGGVPDE
jgi:ubiquitin-activating enzyme E1 C